MKNVYLLIGIFLSASFGVNADYIISEDQYNEIKYKVSTLDESGLKTREAALITEINQLNEEQDNTQSPSKKKQNSARLALLIAELSEVQKVLVGILAAVIIDNSGSMEKPWKILLKEMQNILDIHPEIKGIQVMNDQGAYLIKGYAGKNKWAPDTASTRKGIIELLEVRSNWRAQSLSNPVNGIKTAINYHYKPGRKISIYLLGDDLMNAGVVVDATIEEINKLNTDPLSGNKKARIHGIVFAGLPNANLIQYANFIRQLTYRNDGTALFIPVTDHGGWVDCTAGNCGWVPD